MAVDDRTTGSAPTAAPPGGQLAKGAISGVDALFQAVTHLGPAAGIIILAPVIAGLVGGSSPLLLLVAMAAVLLTGLCVVALARKLPSAGGYYTYVSSSLGGRAGFFTAWSYFLYDPPQPAFILLATGGILQPVIAAQLGVDIPWWAITIVLIVTVTLFTLFGARLSARATVVAGIIETVVIVAYAIAALVHAGHADLTPFVFPQVDSSQTLFLAFAFSVLLFTGFESAAPLAEETVAPRRTIPRVVMLSIVIVGIVWIFVDYALVTAWGVADAASIGAEASPFFTLAAQISPWLWILLAVALLNSALAISLAGVNAGSRVMFALGRARLLPATLGRTHPRFQTPWAAILTTAGINAVIAIVVGTWLDPVPGAAFIGLIITLGVIVTYILGNVSVPALYLRRFRSEFSPIRHLVVPIVAIAILVVGLYYSLVPVPSYPNNVALFFVIGWMVVGVVLATVLWARSRAAFERAGSVIFDGDNEAGAHDDE